MAQIATGNEEALEAWNGVLFDRFLEYKHLIVDGLAKHGEHAIMRCPPRAGDRVLDVGCSFGDATQRLARIVGPSGSALGVDIAPRFVEFSREDAGRAGVDNARYAVHDVQSTAFEETFDYAFSRFGTMFFASPVAALRNVSRALVPGGTLCMVVWRRKLDNPWIHRAEEIVKPHLENAEEETDEAHCGPGPFSMANADTTSQMLLGAGFTDIAFHRCDVPYRIGADVAEAVEFNMALGPAAEAIRFAPNRAQELRELLVAQLTEALREFETPDGVIAGSSTWIVTARAAADPSF
jgi:ubiquinone/menaquinone biosynthesis C-methylase UbiE